MDEKIRALDEKGKAREKVSVWLGSNTHQAVMHTTIESTTNSCDLIADGNGNIITWTLFNNNEIQIEDNCSGLPLEGYTEIKTTDINGNIKTSNQPNYILLLATMFAGTKYDSLKSGKPTTGTNGLFLSILTLCSDYVEYTVGRPNGNIYYCSFENGYLKNDLQIIGETEQTFTRIKYKLSDEVFTGNYFVYDELCEMANKQSSLINGSIKIIDILNEKEQTFSHDNGIVSLIDEFTPSKKVIENILITDKVEQEIEIKSKKAVDKIVISLVMNYSENEENNINIEFLNRSHLIHHGTIYDGFVEGLKRTFNQYLKQEGKYNKSEKAITKDDVLCGLNYIINFTSLHPTMFQNQTKFSTDIQYFKDIMTNTVIKFFHIFSLEQKDIMEGICNKVLINKRSREKAEDLRVSTKKKLESEIKFTDDIKNFKNCKSKDKKKIELYVGEGTSALGGILKSRDSIFQAGFHVGGKMLSLLKATEKGIFNNIVVNNFYKVLGCGTILSKSKYNKEKLPPYSEDALRWNKIILATDQDIDAYQIRCLMLTCMYILSPNLIEHGFVYIAEAPLFEITLKQKDKKGNDIVKFAYTDKEKDNILNDLNLKGIKYFPPERNKGLGEMDKFTMSKAIMHPDTRRITRVTVADVEQMIKTFKIWLGEDVTDRREIITNNFNHVEFFEDKLEKDITQVLNENYLPYAIEIIKERAIISIDGFKPAHRKLLWTLQEKKLYGKRMKSANIVGDNMSYNVHGDGSIYETLVRMAQDDTLLHPYVNGKGNFGLHTSKEIQEAHMRYTEAGASDINKEFFKDIDKNIVDFIPNFDGQKKEPLLLPCTFPNVLINCNSGIAVGMASKTPSFNLKEVIDLTINYIKDKSINILDYLLSPDLATGGYIIYDKNALEEIYETGKGSLRLRAKYKIEDNNIIITEIPYTTCVEAIVDRVKDLYKSGDSNYKCITNVLDSTELKGMSITIEVKKNTNIEKLMNLLYLNTPLEKALSFNMNIICLDGIPRVLGIKQIINEWLTFRQQCILRSLEYDIEHKANKLHILKGLEKVSLNVDKAIKIIRDSKEEDIIKNLMDNFNIDELQAIEVANMKLRNINKIYILKQTKDIEILNKETSLLQSKINNIDSINETIISDLERVKSTYGQPRKTEILYENQITKLKKEDMIESYNCTILITKENYIKKLLKNNENQNLKEGDYVIDIVQTSNNTELTLISNKTNLYRIKTHELDERKSSQLGTYLKTIIDLEDDEYILKIISIPKEIKDNQFVLYCFENGKIAKVDLKSFKMGSNKSIKAYNTTSKLINILQIDKDIDLLMKSSIDKIIITNSKYINSKGSKISQGIQIQKQKNDSVTELCIPVSQVEGIENIEYYKTDSGKGIGNFKLKTDTVNIL